jgi:hypothetical protein
MGNGQIGKRAIELAIGQNKKIVVVVADFSVFINLVLQDSLGAKKAIGFHFYLTSCMLL